MNLGNRFYAGMSTPWGRVQDHHRIAVGVVSVSTAGHGGIWLSDERIAQLPKHYQPFTGTPRWNEEDEDGALVMQYLGLLSLIPEPLELHVTAADIEIGRESRKPSEYSYNGKGEMRYGGAIVEAYKRQTGDDCGKMICQEHLSPSPGGYRLVVLSDEVKDFMERCDAGEAVEPTTFRLEPYVVHERKKFVQHMENGETWTDNVSGYESQRILTGNTEALENYLEFKRLYKKFKEVVKITHEDKVIWQR